MPKLWSSSGIVALLRKNGFTFVSQHGSHQKYRDGNGNTVIVPAPRPEIPRGTMASIIRQSKLPKHLFD
jgi:predicted RNA binding protein YcfA (HicA-like mRNA interferase family)